MEYSSIIPNKRQNVYNTNKKDEKGHYDYNYESQMSTIRVGKKTSALNTTIIQTLSELVRRGLFHLVVSPWPRQTRPWNTNDGFQWT